MMLRCPNPLGIVESIVVDPRSPTAGQEFTLCHGDRSVRVSEEIIELIPLE